MTMNPKLIFFPIIMLLFIGCDSISENKIVTPPPEICPDGESMGCDDNCSNTPLEKDACGVCGGNGATCEGYWNVLYDLSVAIGGFQFNINNLIITGSTGGVAEEAGFLVSTSTSTVLGFSLSGSTISAGSGILVQINFEGNTDNACIDNLIISDSGGQALNAEIINCNIIKYSD